MEKRTITAKRGRYSNAIIETATALISEKGSLDAASDAARDALDDFFDEDDHHAWLKNPDDADQASQAATLANYFAVLRRKGQ